MSDIQPISETAAINLMKSALETLGQSAGVNARTYTALSTARSALAILIFSLVNAVEMNEDELRGVIEPSHAPSIQH